MSATYQVNINNSSNIVQKLIDLNNRINVNLTINQNLSTPVTFDSITNNLTFVFTSELNTLGFDTLMGVASLIGDEVPLSHIYPTARTIGTVMGKIPSVFNDNLNGYNEGDIATDPVAEVTYICYDNTSGAANWQLIYDGPTGSNSQIIYFNSGSDLASGNSWLVFSGLVAAGNPQNAQILIPMSGVINQITACLSVAPGTGTSRTFTVYKGATGGGLGTTGPSVTIADSGVTGTSSAAPLIVNQFDLISVYNIRNGVATAATGIVTIILDT